MGNTVHAISGSPKKRILVWVNGKQEYAAEHYYVCHEADLYERMFPNKYEAQATRQAKMNVGRAERAWVGRLSAIPRYSYYEKPSDGSYIVHWQECSVVLSEYEMKGAGILRAVKARDGEMEYVLFPIPKCRYCEDTGRMTTTIETLPDRPEAVCIYAEKDDPCPWCEGVSAMMSAQRKWQKRQDEAARTAQAIREEEKKWHSTDSSGL